MILESGQVGYNAEGLLCLNDTPLAVRNLCDKPLISHEPLYKYMDDYLHDSFVLMPAFDLPGYTAFVAIRYAWGMNVNVCLLHTESKIVCCWQSYNFDHPIGLSLRRLENGLEIYLSNDDVTREILYKNDRPVLKSLENAYSDSNG